MEELDLKELLTLFWNKKVKILLIVSIFAALGFIYTMAFVTPEYTSSTTLLLVNSNSTTTTTNAITTADINLNSKLVSTYSELVRSKKILGPVIENLGINISYDKLKNNVSVSSVKDTELIKAYADMNNISLSDLIRNAVMEKIEDEYDLECYKKAINEYKKNPKTYTLDEVKEELGL